MILSLAKQMSIYFSSSICSFVFHSVCDTVMTDYSGVIESPNFPNPYPHNRNCTWIIQATLGNTLNVSFSHFQVETHTSCTYDHLQVIFGSILISSQATVWSTQSSFQMEGQFWKSY